MAGDLNAVMPLITADKAKALMVALAKVPSPLTALFEAGGRAPALTESFEAAQSDPIVAGFGFGYRF